MDKSSREKISKKCLDLVDIFRILCAKVLVTQLCLIFWDSMDCSPPGSSVHGNLQARILEWLAIRFSRDLSKPGIEPGSPALQADSLPPAALNGCIGILNSSQLEK